VVEVVEVVEVGHASDPEPRRFTGGLGLAGACAAVVVVAVVVAGWAPRVVDAWHHGMTTIDTLWYHMPEAARFVQTGDITAIHYVDGDSVTAFYPANSPLLHGIGILALGNDLLSTVIDMAWLALALVAGWAIGRPFRVAPLTVAGVAIIAGTPGLVVTQPGGAYTDIVGLALLLVAGAIIVTAQQEAEPPMAAFAVAALACGFAIGTKYTFVATVAAFTVGAIVLAAKGERVRRALVWVAGLLVTGGFWYFRNLFAVGNPVPSFGIKIGPVALKNLTGNSDAISSVSHFVLRGRAWHDFLLPGLLHAFGPVWWAIIAITVVGMIVALAVGPSAAHRLLGAVAGVSFLAFLVTPQYLQLYGVPFYFEYNLRYLTPAILFGLVVTALVVGALRPRWRWPLFALYSLVLLGTQLDATIWPLDLAKPFENGLLITGRDSFEGLLIGVAVLLVGLALVAIHRRGAVTRTQRRVAVAVAVALALVAVAVIRPIYLDDRYREIAMAVPNFDYTWSRDLHHQRIGVLTNLQYPSYGLDLSNYVQYLGERHPDGSYSDVHDCRTWRRLLNAGRYDYVFLASTLVAPGPAYGWMDSDPSVRRVSDFPRVYRIERPSDPDTCPKATAKPSSVKTTPP
jgi:hypothetical protein